MGNNSCSEKNDLAEATFKLQFDIVMAKKSFVGVWCWYLFCYALLFVLSRFANILTRKRELVALL